MEERTPAGAANIHHLEAVDLIGIASMRVTQTLPFDLMQRRLKFGVIVLNRVHERC